MTRALILTLLAVLALAAPASAASKGERDTMRAYAADTWRSFELMTDPGTGLPSDNVSEDGERSRYTSPTNIGTYLWSTIAARDLGIIKRGEAYERMKRALETVARLERHEPSGQFYNWYDPQTGQKLTVWPVNGDPVYPFLSSVDNGWLGAALLMVQRAEPRLRDEAGAIEREMNWGFYYDPNVGQLRGGAWADPPPQCNVPATYKGDDVYYTCHHYGALNTEPRITSYLGIADGTVPPEHYFKMWRTFPDTCDWSWQEQKPVGVTRNYLGVDVFEGSYRYRGMRLVPSWGGSMFEALMVPLLVPEEEWGPRSWGVNHPLHVRAQQEHGLDEADYGYWGFSPSNNPDGGYREYGVDPIGLEPNGYASDQERTYVDYGFEGCRPGQPEPAAYGRGVVTPHAAFLALEYDRGASLTNLANLRRDFAVYGSGGFYDAVDVRTGNVSRFYLALDQGMIMAAILNDLRNDRMRLYFTQGPIERRVRPTIAPEEFTAGRG
jgi:hypothetical protein